jgi:hypothetical protein
MPVKVGAKGGGGCPAGKPWPIIEVATGKTIACATTKANAEASARARMAAAHGWTPTGKEQKMQPFSFGRFPVAKAMASGEMSFDELRQAVQEQMRPQAARPPEPWVIEIYDKFVIISLGDNHYERRAYSIGTDGEVQLDATGTPVARVWVEVKAA